MYKSATGRVEVATVLSALALVLLPTIALRAQPASESSWRSIGNTLIDRSLAGLATGPVDRVWYSADGTQLMIRTSSGNTFVTSDFETWQRA
jgi:hypothetical protein